MNNAMHNTNKERELRVNGSNANKEMCFEVRALSSTSPPSLRRISNPLGVPNSSLNQYNLLRGNTNGLPKTGVPNSTNTTKSTSPRGIQAPTNSTSPRGSKPQPQPLPKRELTTTPNQPLPKRDTTSKFFHNQILPQIKDPIDRIE